jgi:hypothetical protein
MVYLLSEYIGTNGHWQSFQLESVDSSSIYASLLPDSMRLTSLSFISPQRHQHPDEISVLSLESSYALLAALTPSQNSEIVLLIWDLQYSVLLASHSLPIPSALGHSKNIGLRLALVTANESHALLILSAIPHTTKSQKQSSSPFSSILVVPFTIPVRSTIGSVMGRGADSLKWLAKESSSFVLPEQDTTHEQLLKDMRHAMKQEQPKICSAAFFKWERQKTKGGQPELETAMNYAFVKQILEIVLIPQSKPSTHTPYPSDVLHHLIQQDLISNGMVETGLLEALRLHGDWVRNVLSS